MSSWYRPRPPEPPREENLYDLLEAMVRRTPWKDEEERNKYTALMTKLRAVNIFGYMATKITTESAEDMDL